MYGTNDNSLNIIKWLLNMSYPSNYFETFTNNHSHSIVTLES